MKRLALSAKMKPSGLFSRPALERLYLGQSVEGIVYFDGIETAGVVLEEPGLWDVLRVEGANPVPVLPAGSRYEDAFLIQGALQSGMILRQGHAA